MSKEKAALAVGDQSFETRDQAMAHAPDVAANTIDKEYGGWGTSDYDRWLNESRERSEQDPFYHAGTFVPGANVATNANLQNRTNTLKYSRLADALNNRYYRGLGNVRSGAAQEGGGVALTSQASVGDLYRMPIETEETRQQSIVRRMDEAQKQRELGRQQDFRDMVSTGMTRDKLALYLKRNTDLSDEQIRQITRDFDLSQEFARTRMGAQFDRSQRSFEALGIPQAQASIIMNLAGTNDAKGQVLAQLFGTTGPSILTALEAQQLGQIAANVKASGGTVAQAQDAVVKAVSANTAATFKAMTGSSIDEFLRGQGTNR